jgi:dihydroflavonol-4-reductase
MNKHIYFITGSTGFLGRHIAEAVWAHDPQAELRLLVRAGRVPGLPAAMASRTQLVNGDLVRPETYADSLAGVNTVIHSAALVAFQATAAASLHHTNIAGTRALVEAAAAGACRNFIHISSISASGRQPGQLADERRYPEPAVLARDPYGYSKVMAEREVLRCAAHMRVTLLNPSVIIGPGSRQWQQALCWLRFVPALPMLTTLNSFVDVRDVARAVVLALSAPSSGERYIVTAENVDMLAFGRLVMKVLGSRAIVFPAPRSLLRVGDAALAGLDWMHLNPGIRRPSQLNVDKAYSSQKIQRELGWAPAYSLEQSLRDTLAARPVQMRVGGWPTTGRTTC